MWTDAGAIVNTVGGRVLRVPSGGRSKPALSFTGDNDTGMWLSQDLDAGRNPLRSNEFSFSTGGTERLKITNLQGIRNGRDGTAALPGYAFSSDTDTGLYASGGVVHGTTAGVLAFMIVNSGSGALRVAYAGSAAEPSLSFIGDTDTGAYWPTGNEFSFAAGGSQGLRALSGAVRAGMDGTAAAPAFSFTSEAMTGMYRSGATLGFSAAGSNIMTLGASGLVAMSAGADPAATDGAIYYDSTLHQLRVCENATWLAMGNAASSRRWKQDIQPLSGAMDNVSKLQGVRWQWTGGMEARGKDLGLVAEQVDRVLPAIVERSDDGQPVGLQYDKLTPLVFEALKQQEAEIAELKLRLDALIDK